VTRHRLVARCYDKRGTLIASATNSYTKTHPLMLHFGRKVGVVNRPFLHAEVAALLKCGTKSPYAISIERRTRDGKTALAKPCSICEQAIKAWGVQRVSYTV